MKVARWFSLSTLFCLLCGGCAMHNGPASGHFDGSRFFNPEVGDHTLGDELKWFWQMKTVDWPKWLNHVPQPPPIERVGPGDLLIAFINRCCVPG